MSAEIAHFQNFAKLKDTSLAFNDITVLAGKPSAGKSFVMKFMYAVDESISSLFDGSFKKHYALLDTNKNEQIMISAIKPILKLSIGLNVLIDDNNYIEALKVFNKEKELLEKNDGQHLVPIFKKSLKELAQRQENSLVKSEQEKFHFIFRNILTSIFGDINQIDTKFEYENSSLKIIYNENELTINKLNISEDINNAIFVETPLILEFEKFLPKELFQTPYHIDSLLQELNKNDFSFTSDETNKFVNEFKKSSSLIIRGSVSKSSQGFSFESTDGKSYNIINTSSGTKSIGLLQYLVTNKALKKGSVLYWEEPEVHLHPQWQLKMVDLFVELMNAGVKIVFSTHSPYMADYLNAISKKQKFRDRISFNLFQESDAIVENYILDDDNWDLIQSELLDPLEEIAWKYL